MYQNDFKHVTIVHVLKWVPLFSQENGNFLDDHFLNNMAIFFSITLHCCKILASSWMFAHRFPITFLCYWSNHPYYDIRRYVHCTFKRTNTLSRLCLLFYNKISCQKSQSSYLTDFDRFWRKNLKKRPVLINKFDNWHFHVDGKNLMKSITS